MTSETSGMDSFALLLRGYVPREAMTSLQKLNTTGRQRPASKLVPAVG